MRKRLSVSLLIVAGLAASIALGVAPGLLQPVFAQIANVSSAFVNGDLYFYDKNKAVILELDAQNRALVVPSGSTLNLTGSTLTLSAGTVARASLAEDSLQAYGIPISALRHTTGVPLTVAETAGGFNVSLSSHVYKAQAEITDNETEVSVTHAQFVLPAEYVAGEAISVSLRCTVVKTAAAVDNGSTVDVAVFKQADGAVGSDLSTTTAAATFAAVDTFYTKTFVITPTGLVPGDVLDIEITSSIVDSEAGGGTLRFNMEPPKVLLDVKG